MLCLIFPGDTILISVFMPCTIPMNQFMCGQDHPSAHCPFPTNTRSSHRLGLSFTDNAKHVIHVDRISVFGKSIYLFMPTDHTMKEVRTTVGLGTHYPFLCAVDAQTVCPSCASVVHISRIYRTVKDAERQPLLQSM